MHCSYTQGRAKRRIDEEQEGSAAKRLKRTEEWGKAHALEERKVKALETIAFGLDRLTSVLERVEEEMKICGDLATLRAFKETEFPIGEWDRRERFTDFVINESKKWVEDKLRGKM